MPEVEPTEAIVGAVLDHTPPDVTSASVIVDPAQTVLGPVMSAGKANTVNTANAVPPLDMYEIVVVPGDMPSTTPEEPTVATDVVLLTHVPPLEVSKRGLVEPTHVDNIPVIGPTAYEATENMEQMSTKRSDFFISVDFFIKRLSCVKNE